MLLPTITMFATILQTQRAISPAMRVALDHHRRLRQAMPQLPGQILAGMEKLSLMAPYLESPLPDFGAPISLR